MSVPYLLFSLGGVALLVALNAALFGIRGAEIAGAQTVEAYLTQILPAFRGRSMSLGADRTAALAENGVDGALLLVIVRGDAFVVRKLGKPLLRAVERRGDCLSLRLADVTLPSVRLALGDAQTAAQWERKLSGVLG
ncbi:MAG: hypothetical protein KGL97_03885 [Alphaproteobacteria bacterium]|nr:hypothetical protein [Alphaproteobacteria bacterium]